MSKFIIKNLGKGLGDSFIIEMSKGKEECIIMVDGQRERQSKESFEYLKSCILDYEEIDYVVVTHIDDDHIGGILKLLELPENDKVSKKLRNSIFIYNNITSSTINYQQAIRLEKILAGRTVTNTCKRNYCDYNRKFLKVLSLDKRVKFDPGNFEDYKGGSVITLLHPIDREDIEKVRDDYNRKKKKNGTIGKPYAKIVNQYSIVLLIEFMEKRVLLTGDANIKDISEKVLSLKNIGKLDVIKMPHHGADKNNKGLCKFSKKYDCHRFIVTGENQWNEKHPAKSIMDELHKAFDEKLRIYTKIDMKKYQVCNIFIENDQEINILEME